MSLYRTNMVLLFFRRSRIVLITFLTVSFWNKCITSPAVKKCLQTGDDSLFPLLGLTGKKNPGSRNSDENVSQLWSLGRGFPPPPPPPELLKTILTLCLPIRTQFKIACNKFCPLLVLLKLSSYIFSPFFLPLEKNLFTCRCGSARNSGGFFEVSHVP